MDARPRMLLVYGDSSFAARCTRHFRRRGWNVHLANGGPEACRLLDRFEPHVVIVDGETVEPAAHELCSEIIERRPGQPVVLLADTETPEPLPQVRVSPRERFVDPLNEVLDVL